jgi:hypothetical protein
MIDSISLREKCLSVILLAAISEHSSGQQNQDFQYKDTKKYLGDCKILKLKNQKWDFNDCHLNIISENRDTITLKPYNPNHSEKDIEIQIVVEHDGKTKGRLYVILEGEKHEVKLTSVFHFGSSGLALQRNGEIYNTTKMDHYSHCSHYSSNPRSY